MRHLDPKAFVVCVPGSVTADRNYGHGVGHLHYGTDPGGMDLRIDSDKPVESLVNSAIMLCTYVPIFIGVMPLSSKGRIFSAAVFFTVFHNVLDVRPTLTFVYAQAAIYISSSLHMLSLDKCHKESTLYMVGTYHLC